MARKFSELLTKMSAKDRAEVKARSAKLLADLPLEQLRSARHMTQTNLAHVLGVNQSAISKIEKRTDIYLSTLRSYIEAMGGNLEMQAVFPEGAVRLDFRDEDAALSRKR
jgi:DNA-binding XRE family transcriptional regulator